MNNYPIGVFDSGIGGASVLKELINKMPNEDFIYLSDSFNNPYGDKNDSELLEICTANMEELLKKNCKAIVIACNTASMKVADTLRIKYNLVDIFAIEPAYKMVYDNDYNNTTLIMATKGTVESEKFKKLYNKYNNNKTYIIPCVGLADLIEEGNELQINQYLNDNLSKYKGLVNSVVIGCTHYAFIKNEIRNVLGDIKFYYGAQSVSNHVYDVLKNKNLLKSDNKNGKIEFIDTSFSEIKEKRFWTFINK